MAATSNLSKALHSATLHCSQETEGSVSGEKVQKVVGKNYKWEAKGDVGPPEQNSSDIK